MMCLTSVPPGALVGLSRLHLSLRGQDYLLRQRCERLLNHHVHMLLVDGGGAGVQGRFHFVGQRVALG